MDFSVLQGALQLVVTLTTIQAVLLGTLWGVVIGAMPGLGSVIAISLCLPFTYSMEPLPAISILLGAYCGSVYGGSISAILLNTPGTAQSAATCFDGYPMAKKGHSNKALGWCTTSSVFGGIFSCIALMLLGPTLASFSLKFGPAETFTLIVLALTCIVSVSRGSVLKGMLSGVIGLFLATIGTDPMGGDVRFDFGIFALSAGIDLIAIVVGVFALTEVFWRAASFENESAYLLAYTGMKFPPLSEWKGRIGLLIKSSVIGTCVGILPGTGATTASFISYAEARRTSPRGKDFGTGEADGIIAPEAANNAVTGGALIPTLALGIPGDAVTAVMLVTLTLHGIQPGVRLMRDNPEIVYGAFMILFLANLCMAGMGALVARIFAKLLQIPEALLMATVIVFCLLGSYGVRSSDFDLFTALAAGILGVVFRCFRAPLAPLVIGMVLGRELELNLSQGLLVYDHNFLAFYTWDKPIALALAVTTAVVLFWPLAKTLLRIYRRSPEPDAAPLD